MAFDGRESVQLLGVSSSALFRSGSVPNKGSLKKGEGWGRAWERTEEWKMCQLEKGKGWGIKARMGELEKGKGWGIKARMGELEKEEGRGSRAMKIEGELNQT